MKKHRIRKTLSVIVLSVFLTGLLSLAVYAEDEPVVPEIKYLDENGTEQSCTNYKVITKDNFTFDEEEDTWLVFDDLCTNIQKVVLKGAVTYNLILKDGMEVTVDKSIQLCNEWTSITIYSQYGKTGKLNVGKSLGGGDLDAAIGSRENAKGGTIIINGGIINAIATRGAAIGTGASSSLFMSSRCSEIVINGGTINAESGEGAAIGCREWEAEVSHGIKINGGIIFAKSHSGAGIGSGSVSREDLRNSVVSIDITGGTITAEAWDGAGIGAGGVIGPEAFTRAIDINVTGGEITAKSREGSGIGIGRGSGSQCRSIKLMGYDTVKASSVWMDAISRECENREILTINPMYVIKAGEDEDSLAVVDDIYQVGEGYVELRIYNQGANDMLRMTESYEYGADVAPVPETIPPAEEIPGNPSVKYIYRLAGTDDNWKLWEGDTAALDVGSYEMRAVISETESFEGAISESEYFEVTKGKWKDIVFPETKTLSCSEEEQELVKPGNVKDAKGNEHPELIKYSLDGKNYSAEIPKGKVEGEYKVFFMISGNENYREYVSKDAITVKITHRSDNDNPKTGDSGKVSAYALLMIFAAAIFGNGIAFVKKKNNR